MGIDNENIRTITAAGLCNQVKERFSFKTAGHPPPRTKAAMKRLVHELEIHQIKLVAQNAELLQAREELEASRNRYAELYDFAPVGYFTFDARGRIKEANLIGAQMLGIDRHLLSDIPFYCFIADGAGREVFSKHLENVSARHGLQRCEIRLIGKDSRVIFGQLQSVAGMESKDGCILCSIVDGTLDKQLKTDIQDARDSLVNIINAIADPVFVKDEEHRLVLVNDAQCKLTGLSREDLLGKTDYQIFPTEQVDVFWAMDNKVLLSGRTNINEERITDAAGCLRTVLTSKSRYVDPSGKRFVVGVISDITKRKQMEDDLAASEQQFRTLAENSPDVIVRYDQECRRLYVNPAFEHVNGVSSREVLGKSPLEFSVILAPKAEYFVKRLEQVLESGMAAQLDLFWTDRGIDKFFFARLIPEFGPSGQVASVLTIWTDITDRKHAEEVLRKNEARFRGYFDLPCHGVAMLSPEREWIQVNDRVCSLLGYTRDEISCKKWSEMTYADDIELDAGFLNRLLSGQIEQYQIEKRFIRKDGAVVWTDLAVGCVRQPDGKVDYIIATLEDITEHKRAAKSLNDKREQLAVMTRELCIAEEQERLRIASILHDHIGQTLLLCRIKLGALRGALLHHPAEKVVDEVKELLDQATHDAHSLTVQLNPPILAAAGLEAALGWLANKMGDDYGLWVDFYDDLQPKRLSSELCAVVYQVARELLINAARHANTDRASLGVSLDNGMYRLVVEDWGKGFDPAALLQNETKNCRFGLFSVKIKIERLGGTVSIDCEQGLGCRIAIMVPLPV